MKITKEYLRKLITEAIYEQGKVLPGDFSKSGKSADPKPSDVTSLDAYKQKKTVDTSWLESINEFAKDVATKIDDIHKYSLSAKRDEELGKLYDRATEIAGSTRQMIDSIKGE